MILREWASTRPWLLSIVEHARMFTGRRSLQTCAVSFDVWLKLAEKSVRVRFVPLGLLKAKRHASWQGRLLCQARRETQLHRANLWYSVPIFLYVCIILIKPGHLRQAERYDEMADSMKAVGDDGSELSVEERNLLSVAYKNTVGSRRAAWRIISSVEQKEKSKGNEVQAGYAKDYRVKVENELQKICDTILKLLDQGLIPKATQAESKAHHVQPVGALCISHPSFVFDS